MNYYVPEECYEPILVAREAFQTMDGKQIPMNLIVVRPGDPPIVINKKFSVIAFETVHRCPSQGYAIQRIPPKKRKEEYMDCSTEEIRDLIAQGIDIRYELQFHDLRLKLCYVI